MKIKMHDDKPDLPNRKKGRFLLFPKTIGEETRWLEYTEWEEKIVSAMKWWLDFEQEYTTRWKYKAYKWL
jgi:hypothetical protein